MYHTRLPTSYFFVSSLEKPKAYPKSDVEFLPNASQIYECMNRWILPLCQRCAKFKDFYPRVWNSSGRWLYLCAGWLRGYSSSGLCNWEAARWQPLILVLRSRFSQTAIPYVLEGSIPDLSRWVQTGLPSIWGKGLLCAQEACYGLAVCHLERLRMASSTPL